MVQLDQLEDTHSQCASELKRVGVAAQGAGAGAGEGAGGVGGLATGGLPENTEYSEEIEDEKEIYEKQYRA